MKRIWKGLSPANMSPSNMTPALLTELAGWLVTFDRGIMIEHCIAANPGIPARSPRAPYAPPVVTKISVPSDLHLFEAGEPIAEGQPDPHGPVAEMIEQFRKQAPRIAAPEANAVQTSGLPDLKLHWKEWIDWVERGKVR